VQEIFLTYIAPCHYNAIRRRTSSMPRIFALSRTNSSIEAAMRQADRQGLPRNQVRGLGRSAQVENDALCRDPVCDMGLCSIGWHLFPTSKKPFPWPRPITWLDVANGTFVRTLFRIC